MFVSVRQHVLATLLRLRAVEPGRIYILDAGGHYKRSALQKSDPTTAAPEPSPTSPAPPIALVSTAGSVATITGKVDTQPGRSVLVTFKNIFAKKNVFFYLILSFRNMVVRRPTLAYRCLPSATRAVSCRSLHTLVLWSCC